MKKEEKAKDEKPKWVKKLLPVHWAREEGLDEALFLYYNSKEVTREEYEEIKKKAL